MQCTTVKTGWYCSQLDLCALETGLEHAAALPTLISVEHTLCLMHSQSNGMILHEPLKQTDVMYIVCNPQVIVNGWSTQLMQPSLRL